MQKAEIMVLDETKSTHGLLPWLVCFSAALFFFYEFIQMNMFNAISSQLMQAFSLNATQLGLLSANYFYSNLIFLLPAGLILDRVSTRKVILISLSICIIGTLCFALSTNFYLASLFRFLTGIGSAFCFLSCIRLASRWFPSHKMALVSGLIVTMAMAGGMVAQVPLTSLVGFLGWRDALLVDVALGIIILLIIFNFVQDYPAYLDKNMANEDSIYDIGFWKSISKSYLNLQNWLCGIYTCLMNAPFPVLGALWGDLYLRQHHFTAVEASLISSMLFIGTILGSPLAGLISDKMANRKIPMIIGAILSFILIMLIIKFPFYSVTSFILLFFALGLITSTQVISYPTVAESNPHALTATSVSVVSFSAISGYAIFQPLFGKLMDWNWSGLTIHHQPIYFMINFETALFILPVAFFLALCAALLINETHCRREHE